jgi:hypothetical protein
VWQFPADGQPEQIASVLAEHSLGILMKTHNGTEWMSRYDRSPHAIYGPEQVARLAEYYEACGVPFHAWYVARGLDPVREAQMCAEAIDAGARSMTVDLEPFDLYWLGTPDAALAFGNEFRRLQPEAKLYVTVDPRPWMLAKTPVAEFASFSQALAPMTYWDTFNSPANWRLFTSHGFPPGERGVTPEYVLDVTREVLSPYGLPILPAGEGSPKNGDAWVNFVSHAYDLGMSSVSVWRYGTADQRVWPLLKDMGPRPAAA